MDFASNAPHTRTNRHAVSCQLTPNKNFLVVKPYR